jgi:hypothetical protein
MVVHKRPNFHSYQMSLGIESLTYFRMFETILDFILGPEDGFSLDNIYKKTVSCTIITKIITMVLCTFK